MRHLKTLVIGSLPIAITVLALATLSQLGPPASLQSSPIEGTSACVPTLQKYVEPGTIDLGQTAQVTLIMTHTCPAQAKPIDLVFLADISNSMTRARGNDSPSTREPPDPGGPRNTPDPGDPGVPRDPGTGDDPPGCALPGGDSGGPRDTPGPGPGPRPTPGLRLIGDGRAVLEPAQRNTPSPTPMGGDDTMEPGGEEDLIREIQQTMREILDEPAILNAEAEGRLRVGLATFNDRGTRVVKLSERIDTVRNRVTSLRGSGHSRVDLGLRTAETMFVERDRFGRIIQDDDRAKILLVLSDGLYCRRDFRPGAGNQSDQIEIVTMAAGRNADRRKLRQLASENEYVLELQDVKEFIHLFDTELTARNSTAMETALVHDELMPNVELVPGSQNPPTMTVSGSILEWNFPLPGDPITVSYEIEPQEPGVLPVSYEALLHFTDTLALTGTMIYPDVSIVVNPPTATPTPTSTSTPTSTPTATEIPPTATPTPGPRYLPLVLRAWPEPTATATPCVPEDQVVDIALVIDTSNSMSDPTRAGGVTKIDAAVGAGKVLVELLLPTDRSSRAQVTVVGFNGQPTVASALTGDRQALFDALDRLPGTQAGGTFIGEGLAAGLEQLQATSRPGAKQTMIVLTDGEPADGNNAISVADQFKASGNQLFSIGLGQLSEEARTFLQQIASPGDFVSAPDAEDLELIYREIGTVIPCP